MGYYVQINKMRCDDRLLDQAECFWVIGFSSYLHHLRPARPNYYDSDNNRDYKQSVNTNGCSLIGYNQDSNFQDFATFF